MNQSNPTPPASKARPSLFHYITLGAALLGVFLLWRQQTETRQSLLEIVEQKQALEDELKSVKAELDDMKSGDSSTETRERLAAARSAKTSTPEKEAETLVLQPLSVTQCDEGLSVLLSFEPTTSGPFDSIALVVRVPKSSDGRIIAVEPPDESLYADIKTHIDASGKFAVFQGTPADLKLIQINLTVSGPTKAVVHGSSGIEGFELDITPERVESRNL